MVKTITPTSLASEDQQWIIDVRQPDEYQREHIPGSQNIPLDRLISRIEDLKSREQLIVSCQSGVRAHEALHQLHAAGLTHATVLEGSLNGWKQAKLPTNKGKGGISVMRQVQLIVGGMVLAGTLTPGLRWLALIAGAGLLVAGLTNTCMLASALQKMPWNKAGTGTCSLP